MNSEYTTHEPVLKKILSMVDNKKPILELGCGYGSTPILHDFCIKNKIKLYTLENNKEWISKIIDEYKENEFHIYDNVINWEQDLKKYLIYDYSLVFIDQSPWDARTLSLNYFKEKTDYIMIHDCDYFPKNKIFGKEISPIRSQNDHGLRTYDDVLNYYIEYFPKNFASHTGPPTLLGSQFNKINFLIDE